MGPLGDNRQNLFHPSGIPDGSETHFQLTARLASRQARVASVKDCNKTCVVCKCSCVCLCQLICVRENLYLHFLNFACCDVTA
jgi:hypothetical protein